MTGRFTAIYKGGVVVDHLYLPDIPNPSAGNQPREATMTGVIDKISGAAKQAGADFSPALTSIMSKAEALAEQRGITKAQAVLETCMANPAAYAQYRLDHLRRAANRWN